MSEQKKSAKAGRPSRTLEEEITATEQRLQQLRTKKRDEEKRELEKNQKAIIALVRSAGLDSVPAEKWQAALPKLTELLTGEKKAKAQAVANSQEAHIAPKRAPAESGAALVNSSVYRCLCQRVKHAQSKASWMST
jgi:hypothetical protein